ncbi:hypothetical protein F2P81_006407 [Scophthalmus maximus]|uniref:ribonuclease H n=1 Tax=Scophthalmus maximus TaxID=52904 RepID=A0A6A4T6L1_SCOMX|nr:hypothetical protein F2P81_006407 [Scophthalmus maximus]
MDCEYAKPDDMLIDAIIARVHEKRVQERLMDRVKEVVSSMPSAKVFSVLDAKSGFLQIELDDDSSLLTTFKTPVGRFRWLRLSFGLKCAPEIFQCIMDGMLEGISGATAIIDDILIEAPDMKTHDVILRKVIEKATSYNLKLNFKKCLIRQSQVPYVGHLLTADGLKPDLAKVEAVRCMAPPTDKKGVCRFLGFVMYLSKFIRNVREEDAPLCQLLKSDVEFSWQPAQQKAFDRLKDLCSLPLLLKYYDPAEPVQIFSEASSSGLGAVLLQGNCPVAFSTRSLTDAVTRYAQIEKEMLSIVHACTKFHHYIFGKQVTVYNDHKTLLATPMHIQKMRLRLQWYDLTVRNNCSQPLIDAFHQFVTHLVFVEKQMSDRHCGPVSLLCDYKSTWQLRNENNFQNCHCIMAGSHKRFLFYT